MDAQLAGILPLKLCPFCGHPVSIEYNRGSIADEGWWITCNICRRAFIYADERGVALWNTRPIEDELQKRIDELERER